MSNKIAIGTAQFGMIYGVANKTGQVAAGQISEILSTAYRYGVDTLDTAVAYGEAESQLGRVGVQSWRIVSKLPGLPGSIDSLESWVFTQVTQSLARMQVHCLDGLLLHRPEDLLGSYRSHYLRALNRLKEDGLVRSIGISIYDVSELDAVWAFWQPEIVQAPLNVLDRRLITSGWMERLADAGTRVHARSAFLQGILLMSSVDRPSYFNRWRELFDAWQAWCDSAGTTPLRSALQFLRSNANIERIVVGVDSVAHLKEIIEACVGESPEPPANLISNDIELIEPRLWKLQ